MEEEEDLGEGDSTETEGGLAIGGVGSTEGEGVSEVVGGTLEEGEAEGGAAGDQEGVGKCLRK